MKHFSFLFLVLFVNTVFAQDYNATIPLFKECEGLPEKEQENCFYQTLHAKVLSDFNIVKKDSVLTGAIYAVFEVDTLGVFKPLYIDAPTNELKQETSRFFQNLPKVKPVTYAGRKTYSKFNLKISLPLQNDGDLEYNSSNEMDEKSKKNSGPSREIIDNSKELTEFDDVAANYKVFSNPQFKSYLNYAFSHQNYAVFDAYLNQVGSNNHTAVKPYSYAEINRYYDFQQQHQSLYKQTESWLGRKVWNENLIAIEGQDYWFTLNPILDVRLGKDFESELSNTFVNTRGLQLQGGLGSQLTFSASVFESQGRFADYYNVYSESIKPSGGNPAIVPGIGIAKKFKDDAYDFPMAEANIKFKPSKLLDLQLGYGRNFIGDGYRSLLQGDGVSPYPYFKINTTFWKIKYTNTYMWLKDVRPEVTVDGAYATKYMASHYLSYNLSKRLNIGLFENVVWYNTNDRGFDANFVNPIIFYRAVEFSSSSKAGNAVLGATAKYKWNNQINLYGQFLLDEFAISDVKAGNKSWRNKFGYQFGVKYYDAFKVKNLQLQLEYNHVRPYVYSHSNPQTNYAHNNLSMGHQWGGNFRELVAIARYYKGRLYGEAKFTYGQKGFDFNNGTDNFNYGGNIFLNYEENRPKDVGVAIAQGNKTNILIGELQIGYLVNPSSNLKVFGNVLVRNFDPTLETSSLVKSNTTWLSIGLRTDLFNWYFDY